MRFFALTLATTIALGLLAGCSGNPATPSALTPSVSRSQLNLLPPATNQNALVSRRAPSACDPSSYCVTISPGHPASVTVCYELSPPSSSCQPGSWYWLTPGVFYMGRRHYKGPVTTIDLSFNPIFGNATQITVTDNGASRKHSYFASILNCTAPSGSVCYDSGVLRISVQ